MARPTRAVAGPLAPIALTRGAHETRSLCLSIWLSRRVAWEEQTHGQRGSEKVSPANRAGAVLVVLVPFVSGLERASGGRLAGPLVASRPSPLPPPLSPSLAPP